MHYRMQMQMHGRRPERPLIPNGAPGRTRTDTGALLGGRPLPLGYGGALIVPFFRHLSGRQHFNIGTVRQVKIADHGCLTW